MQQTRIRDNVLTDQENFVQRVWLTAINAKQNGLPDEETVVKLTEQGLTHEEAIEALRLLEPAARKGMTAAASHMKRAALACVLGLLGLFIVIPNFSTLPMGAVYLSGVLLIYGAIAFFHAESEYQKCRHLLQVMEEEKQME